MVGMRRFSALAVAAVAGPVVASILVAGCSWSAPRTGPQITLTSAQITYPNAAGTTDAYVEVQNNGPADRLISAHISVGGKVALRSPFSGDGTTLMRTVSSILIPKDTFFRLTPYSSHLLITDSGKMKAGTEITLTLVFAHAGAISVPAMVTNPQTGGASYFLN
jgi:copper(I)-binding protein